ncbi:hypothetical protein Tco_1172021 [Tanacetum coccineum]
MHEDYEYVKSLEKEVGELESEKANFSNIYDLLLEECVSKDVTCSYLHSLSDSNAYAELQCMYLHKMKNNPVCKENASNVFRKEREQYHEIQDLKAQMQDKNIAVGSRNTSLHRIKHEIGLENEDPVTLYFTESNTKSD